MERTLLTVPNTLLRQKSKPLKEVDSYVKELAQFLLSQLELIDAAGLAAVQYGELVRLIVVRFQGIERVFVNPEIATRSEKAHWLPEGCRSIPGLVFAVKRPKIVKVKGLNLDGEWHSLKAHDILAQLLCHEIDHCDGLMIDKTGRLLSS